MLSSSQTACVYWLPLVFGAGGTWLRFAVITALCSQQSKAPEASAFLGAPCSSKTRKASSASRSGEAVMRSHGLGLRFLSTSKRRGASLVASNTRPVEDRRCGRRSGVSNQSVTTSTGTPSTCPASFRRFRGGANEKQRGQRRPGLFPHAECGRSLSCVRYVKAPAAAAIRRNRRSIRNPSSACRSDLGCRTDTHRACGWDVSRGVPDAGTRRSRRSLPRLFVCRGGDGEFTARSHHRVRVFRRRPQGYGDDTRAFVALGRSVHRDPTNASHGDCTR